ncbi:hypothetical protein C8F01DRAFT_1180234 [Mycena amicta]|nr:hypothetical protein C8F01DRAFT_1180234 [Mycena amicta]
MSLNPIMYIAGRTVTSLGKSPSKSDAEVDHRHDSCVQVSVAGRISCGAKPYSPWRLSETWLAGLILLMQRRRTLTSVSCCRIFRAAAASPRPPGMRSVFNTCSLKPVNVALQQDAHLVFVRDMKTVPTSEVLHWVLRACSRRAAANIDLGIGLSWS